MPKKQKKEFRDRGIKKGQTDTEGLDEIYTDNFSVVKKPIIVSRSGVRVYYFVVALIIGFIGGVLGELYVNNYFSSQGLELTSIWGNSSEAGVEKQVIILKSSEVNKTENELSTLIEAAGASVVGIFSAKDTADVDVMWDNLYLPEDQLGNGMILTSDGWIVTTKRVISDVKQKFSVVLADKKIFAVTDVVADEMSGSVFLKIEANDLKVVKFGRRDAWMPGEQLLVLANSFANGGYETIVTNLEKLNYQEITKPQDLLRSSEVYKKQILLTDEIESIFSGSPVINAKGEIIGLVHASDRLDSVLPADYFSPIIKSLLATQEISRPILGVNYLDLAHTLGLPEKISEGRSQGAVLYGEKESVSAVIPGSPAAKAGLKPGDIIIKVNNEPVDAKHSLTELVQQYQIGDVLKLVVIFQGNEREVEAVLVGE